VELEKEDPTRTYRIDAAAEEGEALDKLEPFVVFEGFGEGDGVFSFMPISKFNLLYGICLVITGLLAVLSWLVYYNSDDWTGRITFSAIFVAYLTFFIYKNWQTGRA